MNTISNEEKLRKEYDQYRLRAMADALNEYLEELYNCESCGYYITFDDWLEEYKPEEIKKEKTIAEILEERKIDICMYTRNIAQCHTIDICSISIPLKRDSLSIAMEDEIYDNAIDTYDVWENGAYIKSDMTLDELNEYLQELYNEYN